MKYFFGLAIVLSLASCSTSRVYFTVAGKKQLDEAGIELKKIQFYPSSDLLLSRQLSKEEIAVYKGKVRIENGRQIEEVIIPSGTPGVCEWNDEKSLRVSFDQGDGKQLIFLVEKRNGVVVEESHFKIAAKEWVNLNNGNRIGKVDYQGKVFNLVRGQDARLMIDKERLVKTQQSTTVVKGRKL